MAWSGPVTPLSLAAQDYLRLRRSLGHDLAEAHRLLPRFVAYLDTVGCSTITVDAALSWAQQEGMASSSVWPRRMTVARGFARYMAGIDRATEVPPLGLIPSRQRWRPPFIYTPDQVTALMQQARSLRYQLPAATHTTVIGLLAATGMRVGEALRLDRTDIDWADGVVLVRESKFGKSRYVPVTPSTLAALDRYAVQRDRLCPAARTPSFFVSVRGTRVIYAVVQEVFRRLCDNAGIGIGSPTRPRVHDYPDIRVIPTLTRSPCSPGVREPRLSA
jgi:integrase/recombinase XerD